MRNKFVSLILGLMIILLAPAVTSCEQTAKLVTQHTEKVSSAGVTAPVYNLAYHVPELAPPDMYLMQDAQPASTDAAEETIPVWMTIVAIALGLLFTFFGVKYKLAVNVINEVHKALQESSPGGAKITVEEIKKIVDAFKGSPQ